MAVWLYRVGGAAFRRRRWFAGVWALVFVAVAVAAVLLKAPTSDVFNVPGTESQKALNLSEREVPGDGRGDGSDRVCRAGGWNLNDPRYRNLIAPTVALARKVPQTVGAAGIERSIHVAPNGKVGFADLNFAVPLPEDHRRDEGGPRAGGRSRAEGWARGRVLGWRHQHRRQEWLEQRGDRRGRRLDRLARDVRRPRSGAAAAGYGRCGGRDRNARDRGAFWSDYAEFDGPDSRDDARPRCRYRLLALHRIAVPPACRRRPRARRGGRARCRDGRECGDLCGPDCFFCACCAAGRRLAVSLGDGDCGGGDRSHPGCDRADPAAGVSWLCR